MPEITDVAVRPLNLALLAPFGISGGSLAAANNVLVTVCLADGTLGYGEAAPLPAYNGETQALVFDALSHAAEVAIGRSAQEWRLIGADFRRIAGHRSGSAQCALETAVLDALTKSQGQPLWSYFGGAGTEIETDMTITTGTPDQATAAARDILQRGIRMIKTKVGGPGGVEHDLARIDAIVAVAPAAPLILDGNAGLSRSEASALTRGLKQRGIQPAVLEQWLAKTDLAGLRALGEETGWTVAADESVVTAEDARAAARERAVQVINVKLMKAGVAEALEVVRVARESGLGLMIGGNVESILAMTMSASFAAGLGGFTFADLDTPWFLAENPFTGGYRADGGMLSVGQIAAGHGVVERVVPNALHQLRLNRR